MAAVFDFLRAITKYWFRIKNGISWGTFFFQIGEYERVKVVGESLVEKSITITVKKTFDYKLLTYKLNIAFTQMHRNMPNMTVLTQLNNSR